MDSKIKGNLFTLCEYIIFLGVPACFAAQSACYGLRYRFGAVRTMLTHALRMPNAVMCAYMYAGVRVRDSSEKPAMSIANEVQAWHATSLPAHSPT